MSESARQNGRLKRAARSARVGGFTLLEVLISLVLMVAMIAGLFGFYITVLKARETGGEASRDSRLMNALLQRMAEEIRHATDMVPGDGEGFSGTHDRLVIVRTKVPELYSFDRYESMADKLPPGQLDLSRITYELVWDDQNKDDEGVELCHGLLRSEQRTLDPNPNYVMETDAEEGAAPPSEEDAERKPGESVMPVERELAAPEVKYVRFEYFDGAEWLDKWQATQGASGSGGGAGGGTAEHALPQAVRITLGKERVPREEEETNIAEMRKMEESMKRQLRHPDRWTMVVYLEEADQSMLSSRQFGSNNNTDLQMGGE